MAEEESMEEFARRTEKMADQEEESAVRRDWRPMLENYLMLFMLAGLIIALDQLTKAIIRQQLAFGQTWMPLEWLVPYARLVHWRNTGAAFGLFQGGGGVFTVLAVVVAGIIIYYFPQVPPHDWALRLAMSMQLGGAVGNLIDRVTRGYVTDFISVGTFPVFNIADSSISLGVAVLLLGVWLNERREKAAENEIRPPEEEGAGTSQE